VAQANMAPSARTAHGLPLGPGEDRLDEALSPTGGNTCGDYAPRTAVAAACRVRLGRDSAELHIYGVQFGPFPGPNPYPGPYVSTRSILACYSVRMATRTSPLLRRNIKSAYFAILYLLYKSSLLGRFIASYTRCLEDWTNNCFIFVRHR
jgi:hypothetical protein